MRQTQKERPRHREGWNERERGENRVTERKQTDRGRDKVTMR